MSIFSSTIMCVLVSLRNSSSCLSMCTESNNTKLRDFLIHSKCETKIIIYVQEDVAFKQFNRQFEI